MRWVNSTDKVAVFRFWDDKEGIGVPVVVLEIPPFGYFEPTHPLPWGRVAVSLDATARGSVGVQVEES